MKRGWSWLLENLVIAAGILAFWPAFLGYGGWPYHVGLLIVLVALAIVAMVRMRRVRQAFGKDLDSGSRQ